MVDSDDVMAKGDRPMIYQVAPTYVFALFVLRGLTVDSHYLRTTAFSELMADTAAKLTALRVKTTELMFAPLFQMQNRLPGPKLRAGAMKTRVQIDQDLADAVSCAEACAERLRTDGAFDDGRLVQFFLSKAPFLSTEQKRNKVAREISAYTRRFVS